MSATFIQVESCGYLQAVIVSRYEDFSRYNSKYVLGGAESSYVGIRSSLKETKHLTKVWESVKNKYKFVTFNDLTRRGNQAVATYMAEFLQSLFPHKSGFEV